MNLKIHWRWLAWFGLAFVTGAFGQGIFAPPSGLFAHEPLFPSMVTNRFQMKSSEAATNSEVLSPLLQWGPVDAHPHFLDRFIYGDGVPATPSNALTTAINEFSPGLLLQMGTWSLDYTPTIRVYSNSKFQDAVDQLVQLEGAGSYEAWTFGISQKYHKTTAPLIETANQTEQETYSTALNAVYAMGSQMSLEMSAAQNFQSVQNYQSLKEWVVSSWLNDQIWPQFGAALGVVLGYDNVSAGADMPYEQIQGRINFHPGEKLSLVVNGGIEDRQFVYPYGPPLISPVYGIKGEYQIFEPTTLSVQVNRMNTPSLFAGQITERTDIEAGIKQKVYGDAYLEVDGGYSTVPFFGEKFVNYNTYLTTTGQTLPPHTRVAGYAITRQDYSKYVKVSLNYAFLQGGTASVFYEASENTSGLGNFTYTSQQVGVELGFRF